jgi:ribosomal protein S18 acetylase RimI-like enzyme
MTTNDELEIIRIDARFEDWEALLALILSSFASMDGVIDPPSSAHGLTPEKLARKAETEIGFAVLRDQKLVGCMFCRPEPEFLYLGKLAVSPDCQGKGIGRMLLTAAEDVAREMRLPALRLETRIELTGNHRTFARWGFEKTTENSHPGFDRTTSIEMQKRLA